MPKYMPKRTTSQAIVLREEDEEIEMESGKEISMLKFLPKLNRSNYTLWSMQMRVILQAQDAWEAVNTGGDAFSAGGASYRKDRQALMILYQAVPKDFLPSLADKDGAKLAWDAIKAAYVGHDRVRESNLQTLKTAFENLRMTEDEAVDDFSGRMMLLVSEMRTLGEKILEIDLVRKFLRASTTRYHQVVTSIEQCVPLDTLSVEDLVGRYKAYDVRCKEAFGDPKQGENLLLTKAQWRTLSKMKNIGVGDTSNGNTKMEKCGSAKKGEDENFEKPKRNFDKRKIRCYNCQNLGHFASECSLKKKVEEVIDEEAHLVSWQNEEPTLLMAKIEESVHFVTECEDVASTQILSNIYESTRRERTVEVNNVSFDVTEQDVEEFFSYCGNIENVEMQGFKVLVTFKDLRGVNRAVDLSGEVMVDFPVSIKMLSRDKEESDPQLCESLTVLGSSEDRAKDETMSENEVTFERHEERICTSKNHKEGWLEKSRIDLFNSEPIDLFDRESQKIKPTSSTTSVNVPSMQAPAQEPISKATVKQKIVPEIVSVPHLQGARQHPLGAHKTAHEAPDSSEPPRPLGNPACNSSAENLMMGQPQKGGPASIIQFAATKNVRAYLIGHDDEIPANEGVAVVETDMPSQRVITETVLWAVKPGTFSGASFGAFDSKNLCKGTKQTWFSVMVFLMSLGVFVFHFCNGGKTSSFVRKAEKSVDMPLDSDVFAVPPGYNAPQDVHIIQGDIYGWAVTVLWVTPDDPGSRKVLYGTSKDKLEFSVEGKITRYKYYNYSDHDNVRWDSWDRVVEYETCHPILAQDRDGGTFGFSKCSVYAREDWHASCEVMMANFRRRMLK